MVKLFFLHLFFKQVKNIAMGCLSATAVAAIKAEIADIDEMIVIVKAAYIASLTNSEVEEYKFGSGSGEGLQQAKRRSPTEIKSNWDELKSERSRLTRKLLGTLNVNMNLRRRRGYCY